jgi:hypothetical protein
VCSLPFAPGELRWIAGGFADEKPPVPGVIMSGEAPVHEVCALYAAQVCPFLMSLRGRHTDEYRRGERRRPVSALLGFRATVGAAVLPGEIQKHDMLLEFGLADFTEVIRYQQSHELTARYAALRYAETVPATSDAEAGLVTLFNAMDDDHPVTGAALMAGAAYLPRVFEMPGLKAFARKTQTATGAFPLYRAIADDALGLDDPDGFIARLAREDDGDPAFRFTARYLTEREREGTLPPLLAGWRREGRRLTGLQAERNPQPRRTSRARRCRAGK